MPSHDELDRHLTTSTPPTSTPPRGAHHLSPLASRRTRRRSPLALLTEFPWWLIRVGRVGGGKAIGILAVWLGWERLTELLWRPQPIHPGGFFRYRIVRYRGPLTALRDGTIVTPGDWVVELHFDNRRLLQLWLAELPSATPSLQHDSSGTKRARLGVPWELLRRARDDLTELAGRVTRGELADVKALVGITLFARAGRRLGFEVHPLPSTWYSRLQRFFFVGLVAIYHPLGWHIAERYRERAWPGRAWMSIPQLLQHYQKGC